MRDDGWPNIVLCLLCALAASLPGVAAELLARGAL